MFLNIVILVLGLVIGSFIGAVTYRVARGLSFIKGRSFCDSCKRQLKWYDNIPVLSFIFLGGKSSCCRRKISWRYPLIEFTSAAGGFLIYFYTQNPILVVLFWLLLTVFVIDFERQIIPDELVFLLFLLGLLYDFSFEKLFAGFLYSLFLLLIHLVTKGKGMGLGDVKLAIPLGFWLGLNNGFTWITGSFLTGGLFASILLLFRLAKLKTKLAFGPFLIFAFLFVLLFK